MFMTSAGRLTQITSSPALWTTQQSSGMSRKVEFEENMSEKAMT